MANIRLLSWNIEVYGPTKYGLTPNNAGIVSFVASAILQANANIVVLQELISAVALQICWSIATEMTNLTGNAWSYSAVPARPGGDRESYGILWQTGGAPNFVITADGAGNQNIDLSPLQFPNSFSMINGRRPAIATFRTTDTLVNFAVYDWHSVPANPVPGLQQSAMTPALYTVNNAGAMQPVTGRILAGDYNMWVTQPEFTWLTNPVPPMPPPAAPGQGAGTTPILPANIPAQYTHLGTIAQATTTWGPPFGGWSGNSVQYRDYMLDNSYWASPAGAPAPGGGVLDLVNEIATPASGLRAITQNFAVVYPLTGLPAFPNAPVIPLPLNVNLSTMGCAFLLYRYAISDHLPVFNSVII
jgi:endonuclease/exonuclease/phosphatase family metal-dependent hydrolase